jgi:hypothetical protein
LLGTFRSRKKPAARIPLDPGDANRKHIGQRCEVGHGGSVAAVRRVLDRRTPSSGQQIDEARHIAGSDL